jgi:hypothetical protein
VDANTNNPPGISLETAETSGVDSEIPGVDYEIPGVGETAELSETAGVSGQLSAVDPVPELDSEPVMDSEHNTNVIKVDVAASSNATDNDDDVPPPLGNGYKSSDDKDDDDNEPEAEREVLKSEMHHPDLNTPSVQRVHGLRSRKPRDYSHLHPNFVHHDMTRYSLKKSLKKFKKKGEAAILKELLQFHMKDIFAPLDASKFSK